jgi:hypothetical protein
MANNEKMINLWDQACVIAKREYEQENGENSWDNLDKYEREDYFFAKYFEMRTNKNGSCKTNNVSVNNNNNNNIKGENTMMNRTNARENRMETLKANGINTNNFFNLNMDIPVGANVEIKINGIPYVINSSNNTMDNGNDAIVNSIMENGYVFNSRTDGRFIVAQTFKMLNERTFNSKTRQYEIGWDAYLRNYYGFMYQFDMLSDELHKLAKMERSNDPEFARLSSFFTKDVVVETCEHYIRQLIKYVKNQPKRKCKGVPYVKLNRYGNVFVKDLYDRVYKKIDFELDMINNSNNYTSLEIHFNAFVDKMVKLPYDTPKCPAWKDAFKGKGGYVTLLNLIKFHGVTVQNYETKEMLDRDASIAYVESLLVNYKNAYWKFHELLKATIALNNFDLGKSIENRK